MSPQEIQSLQEFLNQLVQVRGIAKDPQADALIANAVAQQPDAAYLLVQRALLMEQALNNAKTQIASLQSQIQSQATQSSSSRAFLDPNAWGNMPAASSRPAPMMASAPAPMQQAPAPMQAPIAPVMQSQAPAASPGFFGGGVGSALGTVAATAAGVAGGAFLFQGIEHMMHPNGGGGFMNQSGMAPAAPVENTTVNNYYGDTDTTTQQAQDDSTGVDDDYVADDAGWDDDSSMA
ncbi:MAG: hypothetical protein JWP38_632 [Herbaspirillum sp.]|jgi:hypothetical protein|nr:hypothetical protein [Herbaspirillum sp.]